MSLTEIVLSGLMAIISGFCRVLWQKIDKIENTAEKAVTGLSEYKLHAAETYTTHNDLAKSLDTLNRANDAIFKKLDRIEDKLDGKADK